MTVPVDYVGNEIKVGSEIVYGKLLGRSAGLSRGEVIAIIPADPNHYSYSKQKFVLKVQRKHADGSLVMEREYDADTNTFHDTVPSRPARLQFPERTVVINNP